MASPTAVVASEVQMIHTDECEQRHSALDEADAATELPRHWPAWAGLIVALSAFFSYVFPWGFAPAI